MIPELEDWLDGCAAGVGRTVAAVNCRAQPTLDGEVLHVWPKGSQVAVWCKQGEWYLVSNLTLGKTLCGWSHQAYFEIES